MSHSTECIGHLRMDSSTTSGRGIMKSELRASRARRHERAAPRATHHQRKYLKISGLKKISGPRKRS